MRTIPGLWRLAVGTVGAASVSLLAGCGLIGDGSVLGGSPDRDTFRLLTLDPGHFHAALVQKTMLPGVSPVVHVYGPPGEEIEAHLARIESFNRRSENPTAWQTVVYRGEDYLERMIRDRKGNVVVISGNNRRKIEYLERCVKAGLNVLADKPLVIDAAGFERLRTVFQTAERRGVLLYDIMTERYEITTILQREFSLIPSVFGRIVPGTPEQPAVTKESVHHFSKVVAGAPLVRPAWFFDVTQQGEGLVDVTTHLVDLIQWECFPEVALDWRKDIEVLSARRWPTVLTPEQFQKVTRKDPWPEYLRKDVRDGKLYVYSNGEMIYRLRGIVAKVSVIWNFEAPPGAGDTHYSILRGTRVNLVIRQGAEQNWKPALYIEPVEGVSAADVESALGAAMPQLQARYPGISLKRVPAGWEVIIPDSYKVGHEAHFAQVAEKYFRFLREGRMPAWEVPNMIAKYYTTTRALELARSAK
ncbi:MAG: oxidoreductase [Kiritimatiellae bacterium]|nr:oxidoreductase [Kiritimatiellia bacterium]